METVIAALISAAAVVASPIVAYKISSKISTAKDKAAENTGRAESAVDALWQIIDRQRESIARLEQELNQRDEPTEQGG